MIFQISETSFNRAGRPMSLTDFPSSPTSPRFIGSRHSMYSTGCRPLRSSPLAGPALRVDEAIEEVDERRNQRSDLPRPSRVLSTPNLATLLTLPVPLRNERPKTAESPQEGFSHLSISSPPAKPSKCSLSLFSQRRNSETAPQLQPPSSPPLLQSRSTSSLSLSSSSAKLGNVRNVRCNSNEKEPWVARPAASRRPQTAHGYPSVQHRPITTIPEKQLDQECAVAPAGSRGPQDNSWFTANTYDVTPKFSRLGLAASGVVLPVSAKEHKRLSRPSSRSSMSSSAPAPGALRQIDSASGLSLPSPSPPSTPDVNLVDTQREGSGVITPTLTNSRVSSQCSEDSPVIPSNTVTTSSAAIAAAAASTGAVTTFMTVMAGNELDGSLPRSKSRDESEPPSLKTTAGISKKKNKLFRFKFLQYRTSPKSSNPTHPTSINQGSKLDHPESNEKRKGSNNRGTASGNDEMKLRLVKFSWFTSSESSLSDSSYETDPKYGRLLPVKESSRIRKLWKSIAMHW